MASAKTVEDFPVGTAVEFNLDGIDVHGTVESIQLAKKLVDVKIYEPGHRSHCLIVSRAPETLSEAGEGPGPSSYADLQRRVEGASTEAVSDLQAAVSRLLARVETLESDGRDILVAIGNLQSRVTELETAAKPEPDGGQAASA